ncbi:hypothetical protein [Helicobacter bilis]|uniref:Uncharacterized protein n=2 Tax=Helicobacter bilis TaxID=37372 RepID=A0A6D2CCB3_9HELI|nr:hypothetical protein [Helicobacter bilis]EMZ38195.1 hypothetical protein C826_01708 [Helicobacter bilis WiWa]TLE05936.1 hypothetical protein LS77_001685 [Helicobacter bilis]TLE06716.1 hypothetical protein LS76_001845 [Helicobacter bilis]
MNFKRANTKFDELYEIRLATPNDIDNIMAFLKEYWDKNHILAVNRDFFEYEFRVGDRVNYILAVNRQTGKIDACEGIYIYSKGDDDTEPFDMSGGMFRTSPNALLPFLGLEILYRKRFMMSVKMRSYIGIGAKKETTYILTKKYFKDDMVGRLDHFYRLNDKKEYKIARITHKTILDIESKDQAELVLFRDFKQMYEVFDNESFKKHNPYKSPWYINKRYFNNPVFTYKLYGLESSLVLVCREVAYNGARVLRIVDILGDREQFHRAGQALDMLMKQNDYEYIDLYQKNMDREGLKRAGFVERLEDDINIIPSWFSPYAAKNIEIYYHAYGENLYMFKADGDMDRPCSVDVENLGYRCVKQLESNKDISPFSKAQYDKDIESSNCHTEPLGEVSNVESQQDFSSMAHAKQALAHTYKNDKNLDSIRMHPKPCTHPDLAQNLDSKNHTAHTSTTQNQKSKKES